MKRERIPGMTEPKTVTLPSVTIPLQGIQIGVLETPDGQMALQLGPIAVTFIVPMTAEGAVDIGRALAGDKVQIARTLPPVVPTG